MPLIADRSPIPPEHKLPPYQQAIRLTGVSQSGDVARYMKKLAAQRQHTEKVIREAISKQECQTNKPVSKCPKWVKGIVNFFRKHPVK